MKTKAHFLINILVLIVALGANGGHLLYAYHLDNYTLKATTATGSLDIDIQNVRYTDGSNEWSAADGSLNSGAVRVESAVNLYFDLYNLMGEASFTASVYTSLNHETDLVAEESGVLSSMEARSFSYELTFPFSGEAVISIVIEGDVAGRSTGWAISRDVTFDLVVLGYDYVKLAGGNNHTLALSGAGRVYAFGRNVDGQLGLSDRKNRNTPTLIELLEDVVDIAACNSSSFALTSEGRLYSWGHNGYGHLGNGTYDDTSTPQEIASPTGYPFTKVFAHYNTAGALTADGKAFVWGYGRNGLLGNGQSIDGNPLPIELEIEDVAALDFGNLTGAALTNDGRLYTWGANTYGALGWNQTGDINLPAPVPFFEENRLKVVSSGFFHMAALTEDGRVYTWGYGLNGRLGTNNIDHQTVPQYIYLDFAPKSVAAGHSSTAIIAEDGSIYVFGENAYGELGGSGDVLFPTLLEGVSNATFVLPLPSATLAISNGSTVYGIGNNEYGTLGCGDNQDKTTPTEWITPDSG